VVSLGIFSIVPPTEPCALRSTQPLKVSTRDFSMAKGGRCLWLMTYHPCSAETSRKSGTPWSTSASRGRPLIYNRNWRNISTIYTSNEILVFSPSNKIHREVGRAKDLSAPLYRIKARKADRVCKSIITVRNKEQLTIICNTTAATCFGSH